MFKLKPSKKSLTNTIGTTGQPSKSEKRIQLCQNNDLINTQEHNASSMQMPPNPPTKHTAPTLLRNPSLRPRSGTNRAIKASNPKPQHKTDEQTIQQRIRQKLLTSTQKTFTSSQNMMVAERPSTSANNLGNEKSGVRYGEKRQKLMGRRGTGNMGANGGMNSTQAGNNRQQTFNVTRSSKNLGENQQTQQQQMVEDQQYLTNSQALSILLQILDHSPQFTPHKQSNPTQFTRIRQKLASSTSIMVLKWYKLLQDQLYNEVKSLGATTQQNDQPTNVAKTIEELILQEIRRQFSKERGLFGVEERCVRQEGRLARLIEERLGRLEGLLVGRG